MSDIEKVALILIGIFFVGEFLWALWIKSRFIGALKENHPEVWKSLGEPTLNHTSIQPQGEALNKFIYGEGLESLNDAQLISLARKLRFCIKWSVPIELLFAVIAAYIAFL